MTKGYLTKKQIFGEVPAAPEHAPLPRFDVKHRGPKTGYENDTKCHWRRNVWQSFERMCDRYYGEDEKKRAFIVETTSALELQEALARGFAEEDISICNANPAIVAVVKRRFPKVTTYGVDAETALRRAHKAGIRFAAVSLDLCGPISSRFLLTLDAVRPVMDGIGVVGMTMLRGREPKGITMEIPPSWRKIVRKLVGAGLSKHVLLTDADYMRALGPLMRLDMGPCWFSEPNGFGRQTIRTATPAEEWCRTHFDRAMVYRSGQVSMFWMSCVITQPFKWSPSGRRSLSPGDFEQASWDQRPKTAAMSSPSLVPSLKSTGFKC